MTECKQTVFFPCNFQPRYDYGEPTIKHMKGGDPDTHVDLIEASKLKTYVRDVCERCGKVIERLK